METINITEWNYFTLGRPNTGLEPEIPACMLLYCFQTADSSATRTASLLSLARGGGEIR